MIELAALGALLPGLLATAAPAVAVPATTAHEAAIPTVAASADTGFAAGALGKHCGSRAPTSIALPNGFAPEGLTFGRGPTFFVGSLATGGIWRGNARTGTGSVFTPATTGRTAVGLSYDTRTDSLFAAGGPTGKGYVYNATTGMDRAVLQLARADTAAAGGSFVNDVVVTHGAAWFTESRSAVLYRVPLGLGGRLPANPRVERVRLTGAVTIVPGALNINGIVALAGGRTLLVGNTATGQLYRVDARTGRSIVVDLDGKAVPNADGLVLRGRTLYVVQNRSNQVSVVQLNGRADAGRVVRVITSPLFMVPSTADLYGGSLYLVNARFGVTPGPDVGYTVVRVPA